MLKVGIVRDDAPAARMFILQLHHDDIATVVDLMFGDHGQESFHTNGHSIPAIQDCSFEP